MIVNSIFINTKLEIHYFDLTRKNNFDMRPYTVFHTKVVNQTFVYNLKQPYR